MNITDLTLLVSGPNHVLLGDDSGNILSVPRKYVSYYTEHDMVLSDDDFKRPLKADGYGKIVKVVEKVLAKRAVSMDEFIIVDESKVHNLPLKTVGLFFGISKPKDSPIAKVAFDHINNVWWKYDG